MFSLVPQAHAAVAGSSVVSSVLNPIIKNIVNPILLLVFAIALLVFVYGVVRMITDGGDADAREKGKQSMIYGIIGIFIMLSAWGIINLVSNTVNTFR